MPRKSSHRMLSAMLVLLVFGVLLGVAPAQTETVLYSFCVQTNCADGESPYAGLVFDRKGNLYGTTWLGGANGHGVVFEVTSKGKETVLYSFCSQGGYHCTDGGGPVAGLVFDQKGNLYGTTKYGGAYYGCGGGPGGCGVVFKLTPEGKETVLYSFCAQGLTGCPDGEQPSAGVVFDHKGNLYGTTSGGGAYNSGVVFKLTPKGKEEVLYSFCAQTNCTDGVWPSGGLVLDENGNLYGTTSGGGTYNPSACTARNGYYGCGIVFKITPKGKESVLYNFCSQGGNNCTDGSNPYAGVVFDHKGNLYGTTQLGGAYSCCGVVFKLTPAGRETVLYTFYTISGGNYPSTGLVFDQKGNLYGTTLNGGNTDWCVDGCGVAFKLTPKGKETVLHSFCSQGSNCADGEYPEAGLVFDQRGNLYGTTAQGGVYNNDWCFSECGVVFKLTP